MPTNRREHPRIHCFLPASTLKGDAVIDELSPAGGRLNSPFAVAPGEKISLKVYPQGGGDLSMEVFVARSWKSPVGYRLAWTTGSDPASTSMANRLFAMVAGPQTPAGIGRRSAFNTLPRRS